MTATLLAVTLLLAACTSNAPPPTPTPTPEATPSATAPVATSTESPTVTLPDPRPTSAVWVLDADAEQFTLLEAGDEYLAAVWTPDGLIAVVTLGRGVLYGPDGRQLDQLPGARFCFRRTAGYTATVPPSYEGCGLHTPDGSLAVFRTFGDASVETDEGRGVPVSWWLADAATGKVSLLVDDALACEGCDGVAVAAWSASGRFLLLPSSAGDGRALLVDIQTGAVTNLGPRLSRPDLFPTFHPTADALVTMTADGHAKVVDLLTGSERSFPGIEWPAYWSDDGRYITAEPLGRGLKEQDAETVVISVATGEIAATWTGLLREYPRHRGVVQTQGGGPAGALIDVRACGATTLYHPDLPAAGLCVGGVNATWSPRGDRLAIARAGRIDLLGSDGSLRASVPLRQPGARAPEGSPDLFWNAEGTHLLVVWPQLGGGL